MERPNKISVEVIPGEKKGTIALHPVFLEQLGVVPSSKAAETSGLFSGELHEQEASKAKPGDFKRPSSIGPKLKSSDSA